MVEVATVAVMCVAAFAGGAFGAMLGALHSFIFAGFVIIAGEAVNIAGRTIAGMDAAAGDAAALGAVGLTSNVGFGAVFGPHIAFAGGVAATAYAARKGYMDSDWGYHDGKNIFWCFSCHRLDVVAVGGVFGVAGYLMTLALATVGAPIDPIAASIVVSAALHRVVLGYNVFGRPHGEGYFDVSPFEREEIITTDGGGGEPEQRLAVEPWIPWMYQWDGLTFLGAVVGALAGFIFFTTGSPFLAFGISAASIMILNDGLHDSYADFDLTMPLTHHMTLCGSAGVLAFSGVSIASATPGNVAAAIPMWQALVVGAAFGAFAALVGEAAERVVYAHGDTHWDPPATAIAVTTLLIGVLATVGVLPSGGYIPTL
ncbi:hypothetical protein BRC92_07750 [Halobacteriales archaeon QS_4_69_31]|nr:MAG: hypothetical protein BRC92_07750 [Halobacteriales archaeon QS_4_69_31]